MEVLADTTAWNTPRKVDQSAFEVRPAGPALAAPPLGSQWPRHGLRTLQQQPHAVQPVGWTWGALERVLGSSHCRQACANGRMPCAWRRSPARPCSCTVASASWPGLYILNPEPASAAQRKADGTFAGFEATPPFEYHDGWLSVHFASNNYLEMDLTPKQEEAAWCAPAPAPFPGGWGDLRVTPWLLAVSGAPVSASCATPAGCSCLCSRIL